MTLKTLDSIAIESNHQKVSIPEGTTHYRFGRGRIRFFKINEAPQSKSSEQRPFKKIPENFEYISFPELQKGACTTDYGKPLFE